MSKWVLHSLHAKKTLPCATKPSQQQARGFALLPLPCALLSVLVPVPARPGTPAAATGTEPCPAEVTGRRCFWTFPCGSQVDGIGGTLSFWGKPRNGAVKIVFSIQHFKGNIQLPQKRMFWPPSLVHSWNTLSPSPA